MQRFCFIHAADLHLDTPFEGIRGAAPAVARALRDASLDAFDALVELCLERAAAFLLIAGDVYDGAERGLRAQLRFRAGLERLARAGVAVLVVHGNHDPSEEGWSAIREWPDGVTIFGSDRLAAVSIGGESGRAPLATIYGISYARRDEMGNLSALFPRRGTAPRSERGLRIGLLHCNAGGQAGHAPYAACSVSELAEADVDYWALGHVHVRQVLSREPWIVYPGNLQGRSPHAGEQGEKGAMVVEVENGRVARVEFQALDRLRFLTVTLDVSAHRDLGAVERALRAGADALREEHPGRGLVLSGRLVGRSALERDLARPRSLDDLLESLRDSYGARERDAERDDVPAFLWWASLTSAVIRPIDRDARRARDDFYAQLLGLSDELASHPDELLRFAREAVADLPEVLRDEALPELTDALLRELLQRAEQTALELVCDDAAPSAPGAEA
jgi:DNA repair exonuclease SbcCD nuclease subunit